MTESAGWHIISWDQLGRLLPDEGVWLFRNLSGHISPSERVMIQGPSGSGKTLFLRSISLLDAVDEGEIFWKGSLVEAQDIPRYRRSISYVHQRPALLPGTVLENLSSPMSLRLNRDRTFDRESALKWLDQVGRDERFLTRKRGEISGGEEQIVGLIRTLLNDPEVLLLDEPTASLDGETTASVERLLVSWVESRPDSRALLWVTHDSEQAARLGTRVLRFSRQSDHVESTTLQRR